ncbi:glutamate-cysteine ligase family protein [Kineococcus glutinatus]|uniref:Glutamate-cysteine ligase family protein n=1 Tax=Kineococcus glutinatus TaxID=1070872 RepID=A0ABP9HZ89_9ACTN
MQRRTPTGADRRRFRELLHVELEVLRGELEAGRLAGAQACAGIEVELHLVDGAQQPAMVNDAVLQHLADARFQTELGAFNIELNGAPHPVGEDGLPQLQADLAAALAAARGAATRVGAQVVSIGTLPTALPEHFRGPWRSADPRYAALDEAIATARGEDVELRMESPTGPERLAVHLPTIGPEAVGTSVQLHQQVAPEEFARRWNAAQAVAGPQVALAANSPFLFGRRLWAETRIELFTQSTDTRCAELRNQGVRPRVFFGERWIDGPLDLFEEDVRFFPSLLPVVGEEDPLAAVRAGRAPLLGELRLHTGTVYRWNRAVYDVADGTAHLRVENRVLPAGPTPLDVVADAAFFHGLVRALAQAPDPVEERMPFEAAHRTFQRCARLGLAASAQWPGVGEVPVDRLVLDVLLPLADEGLGRWGVPRQVRDHYLEVVAGRARTGRNGATWQVAAVRDLEAAGLDRRAALARMLAEYLHRQQEGEPVHRWGGVGT